MGLHVLGKAESSCSSEAANRGFARIDSVGLVDLCIPNRSAKARPVSCSGVPAGRALETLTFKPAFFATAYPHNVRLRDAI